MSTVLYVGAVLALAALWWAFMDEAFRRCSHGSGDAVRQVRRTYVERRLGLDRRQPNPPPLWPHKERRKGQRRQPEGI
jgi:hypothetical protein